MINLYRQSDIRRKGKTLASTSKSHTASMHLRTSTDCAPDDQRRQIPRDSARLTHNDSKSRSTHKYKKSLMLQDTTIQLVKRSSEKQKTCRDQLGMSTDRYSRGKSQKRSVDMGVPRLKTETEEVRATAEPAMVEINS